MKRKVFWFDTETTGLDSKEAAIVSLAYIIEDKGKIQDKGTIYFRPHVNAEISEKALEINGFTREQIEGFPEAKVGYKKLLGILGRYVKKYDKLDKFIMAGYNVSFDDGFLRELFKRERDIYYGSWFYSSNFDVRSKVAEYVMYRELAIKNFKLVSVCEHFGIEFKAHDALEDIVATRTLYYFLNQGIFGDSR